MAQPPFKYVQCPLLLLRIPERQVMGDVLCDRIRDELLAAYDRSSAVHLVLDLQEVGFLSSAGIRTLLAVNRRVREREGRLILCGLTREVASVFVTTRLISNGTSTPATFEHQPDVPAAVAGLFAGQAASPVPSSSPSA